MGLFSTAGIVFLMSWLFLELDLVLTGGEESGDRADSALSREVMSHVLLVGFSAASDVTIIVAAANRFQNL